MANILETYLTTVPTSNVNAAMMSYVAALDQISRVIPEIAVSVIKELADQRTHLKLIASENFASIAVQVAMSNLLTDKYAEGIPGHRFYAGCSNVDDVEHRAASLACDLFGADHAYVQPHSGADANLVAYWAILTERVEKSRLIEMGAKSSLALSSANWDSLRVDLGNQRLLGMGLGAGGHLTHGYRANVSGRMFECHEYGVDIETGRIDYNELERLAQKVKPLILLAGYSAYSRAIDFSRMRQIADKAGAVLMVDMAHFAGLVAGKVFTGNQNPFPFADVVTSTTHKTLRGPRGGLVLCRSEFTEAVNRGCPLVLGGPMPHIIAAKAVALSEATKPEFSCYAQKVVSNAKTMAATCVKNGLNVVTGGTDNHLLLLDISASKLTGRQAESALRDAGITVNRNTIPADVQGAWYTSGLRLGTPAVTTLGMGEAQMEEIGTQIARVLSATKPKAVTRGTRAGERSRTRYNLDSKVRAAVSEEVAELLNQFPLYPQLDLSVLQNLVSPVDAHSD